MAYVLPALLISVVVLARPDLSRAAEDNGYLDGTVATGIAVPTNPQDLTSLGATDWAIWGYDGGGTSTALAPDVRKASGSAISDLTDIQGSELSIPRRGHGQFAGPFTFSWTNGVPASEATAVRGGLQHKQAVAGQSTVGYGFSFTVPATTTPQRLTVWTHAHGGRGQLTATLSDGSAPSYVDVSVGTGGENQPGVYTIDFAAADSGTTLLVEWVMDEVLGAPSSASDFNNVAIYAAALAPQLVSNGGFEQPSLTAGTGFVTVPTASPALPGWTVGQAVDHVRAQWEPADGYQSLDLGGSTAAGSITQAIPTEPGAEYLLRFAYSANPDAPEIWPAAAMDVTWDGAPIDPEGFNRPRPASGSDMDWQWVSVPVTGAVGSTTTELSFVGDEASGVYGIALDDVSVTPIGGGSEEPTEVTAPVLMQAVPAQLAGNVAGTGIVGLTETPGTYDLAFYTSDSCVDGVLGSEPSPVGSFQVATTTEEPYFINGFTNEAPMGDFIAAEITGPGAVYSSMSACIAVGPDNDSWVRALGLDVDDGDATATGRLDSPGNARWYKFSISPGARVSIDLTGLPADYDLFLFKDIAQAFNELNDPKDLVQISAEFAPSAFAPSAFAPSAFAPSAFAPSAFAPSAFAPSAFAPSAFAPSAFAPSAFAPSAFAPSAFAPSAFAPSAFAPSAFAPSAFAPSAFAPSAFAPSAFAGAQVRSLIGISAMPATGSEWIVADTWNNTGDFYVRVSGKNGEFDTQSPFTLDITVTGTQCANVVGVNDMFEPDLAAPTAPDGGWETIILTDSSRMPGTISRLAEFATEVNGVVVDVSDDPNDPNDDRRVAALNAQADTQYACPFAKNLVAKAIKDVVDAYRATNPIRYVVIVGGDDVIPFFRYPDQSLLGPEQDYVPPVAGNTASEASLRTNHVLGQDEYGSERTISLRAAEFPVPDLPVGRLVETPADVNIVLAAYLDDTVDGVAPSSSSLVTGYDFIADAADAIADELTAGTGVTTNRLISANTLAPAESWTAAQLRTAFMAARNDLVFLGGHFSANSALAADFATSIASTELASAVDMTNSIIFSIGCHAGYNIVDPHGVPNVTQTLDWPQAFAQKGATLIAGTGYQYGDTDFIEYSERIYAEFAHQLRVGTGPVSVGEALVRAKQAYLRATPDIRGLHEKALLESALFGLPMLSVDMAGDRVPADPGIDPDDSEVTSLTDYALGTPGKQLGLQYADVTAGPPNAVAGTRTLTNLEGGDDIVATFLTGPDGNTTNPAEPALPLEVKNVSAPGTVLRGVGFRGGDYTDVGGIIPLTGAPNTEIRGVHIPFSSNVFYPMRPWTVNYFDALATAGGSTHLLITPAQHRSESLGSLEATLRRYDSMDLRLFYSNNTTTYSGDSIPALAAPPAITGVSAVVDGTTVTFRANVTGDPAAGIQEVWVTYTGQDSNSKWESENLTQDPDDSTLWTGSKTFDTPFNASNLRFMVQAVNGVGLVTVADDLGAYYSATIAGAPAPTLEPSTLSLDGSPASGAFGSSVTVTATLASSGPVNGKPVVFTLGGTVRIATTEDGVATTSIDVTSSGPLTLSATYPGDSGTGPSTASQAFNASKAATQLAITGPGSPLLGVPGQITATLTSGDVALTSRTVAFRLTAPGGSQTVVTAITDISGIARIPAPTSPVGIHDVDVFFGQPVTVPGPSVMDLTDPAYAGSTASTTIQIRWPFAGFFAPVDNLPTVNIVKAGSTVPVKFSLGGDRGLAVLAAGYPRATKVTCASGLPTDIVEETSTANSGLTYDATTGQYKYNWKTPKTYVGLCYRFELKLIDGTTHSANFKFK